ncbi:MAG: hypothetical protein AAF824_16085 [Bacteroidota bacterium]
MSVEDFIPMILAFLIGSAWAISSNFQVSATFTERASATASVIWYATHVEDAYEHFHKLHPQENVSVYRLTDSIHPYRCASDSITY